jgi:hypothetical protein
MAFIPPLIAAIPAMLSAAAPALIGGGLAAGATLLATRSSGSSAPSIVQTPSGSSVSAPKTSNASIASDQLAPTDRRRGRGGGGGEAGLALQPLGARGGGAAARTTMLGA